MVWILMLLGPIIPFLYKEAGSRKQAQKHKKCLRIEPIKHGIFTAQTGHSSQFRVPTLEEPYHRDSIRYHILDWSIGEKG